MCVPMCVHACYRRDRFVRKGGEGWRERESTKSFGVGIYEIRQY